MYGVAHGKIVITFRLKSIDPFLERNRFRDDPYPSVRDYSVFPPNPRNDRDDNMV